STQLDAQGQPLQAELRRYDRHGRLVEIARQNSVAGQPQAPQWLQRYDYEDRKFPDGSIALGQQPSLVSQPSVIAGKTRSTAFEFNEQGQVLRISERGWSPIDAEGQAKPSPLERSTTYRYTLIAGKSVLAEIDGPLPNGPKGTPEDSDVTRLDWDTKGLMPISAHTPGPQHWQWQHDALGYLQLVRLIDGHRQIETEWTWHHSGVAASQVSRVLRRGSLLAGGSAQSEGQRELVLLEASYDALGRRVKRSSSGKPDTAQTLDYDAWGRPARMMLPDGTEHRWSYDAESRLLAATLRTSEGAVIDGRAWLRDAGGQVLASLGLEGQMHLQALQIPAAVRDDLSEAHAQSARLPERPRLQDDFGREVLSRDPEDGRIVTSFSTLMDGGRLLAVQHQRREALGAEDRTDEWMYFDAAGRLVRHRSQGHAAGTACEEDYRYQGALLSEISGCGETQRFTRDALGLITLHERERAVPGQAKPSRFKERFGYDAQGRLQWRELPDEQVLRYGQVGPQDLHLSRLRPWLARLFQSKPNWALALATRLPASWTQDSLVKSLSSDAGRQRALVHGNGSHTRWERSATPSPAAAEARVAAASPQPPAPAPATHAPAVDGFGRLQHWTPASGPFAGERLRLQWNAQHQLQALLRVNGELAARYQYDAAGNRTLKQVQQPGKGLETYQYLYDTQHRLVALADGAGKISEQFLYTDHRAHTVLRGKQAFSLETDWRGLPLTLRDEQGSTRWQASASAFGLERHPDAPLLRLAGQVADEESGLYYNVHRYLDPRSGRYISPDPLGAVDGADRYAYLGGHPYRGIDPLGLFEIPVKYFFNKSDAFNGPMQVGDDGHGDIVRAAFAIYNGKESNRFSKFFIDEVIKNNYQSDAVDPSHPFPKSGVGGPGIEGGGQFNPLNHFDNPHDGPMCKDEACTTLADGYSLDWIKNSLQAVDSNRGKYWNVAAGDGRGDISPLLGAFGQNTHALADFYAHSNWVDGLNRGGKVENKYKEDGKEKLECGWIPKGKNMRSIWDEDLSDSALRTLYTGTVQLGETSVPTLPDYDKTNKVCGKESALGKGDIVCERDKTTHGYWGKDHDSTVKDEDKFTATETAEFNAANQYYWKVETYSGKPPTTKVASPAKFELHWYSVDGKAESELVKGDKIMVAQPITNRHRLAFSLAVAHTLKEIEKLYDNAAGKMVGGQTMQDVFKMDKTAIDGAGVGYANRTKKN
ncbi:RHS repeat-associated core domain-containing protein, partial [Paucibacter sp. DJ1R-11]|uniref:RHS repeat domain-containing protein n=1 Tax=Paucibacter sp. DJ1R-11 TaxID=2893556 RepID=UPI0021E4E6C8